MFLKGSENKIEKESASKCISILRIIKIFILIGLGLFVLYRVLHY